MKLVRYGSVGQEKPGVLDRDGRVRDLSAHCDDIGGETLTPRGLEALRKIDISSLPLIDGTAQRDLRLGACVGGVDKFLAIGLNYADHAAELGDGCAHRTRRLHEMDQLHCRAGRRSAPAPGL